MIELLSVINNQGSCKYYKKCCGNCKHSGPRYVQGHSASIVCKCEERDKRYSSNTNLVNYRTISQTACKYFEFVPKHEYEPDKRLHASLEQCKIEHSSEYMFIEEGFKQILVEVLERSNKNDDSADSKLLEAAKLLKSNCKNNRCGSCIFFTKEGNKCALETKRDFNFNTVPRDWEV